MTEHDASMNVKMMHKRLTGGQLDRQDGPLTFATSKASGESKDKTDRQGLLTLWDSKHTVKDKGKTDH
ncbi:hypothetical protein MTR_5g055918 [Medicago truncatula]|uniref:Uncharacterized protein n=1 Tax=Medicago truncatula TaxID=3880 RepID=A0A072UEB0_MEDTR|nr:hypothetical protein MTR_5g055918 [Medicago truncatula]